MDLNESRTRYLLARAPLFILPLLVIAIWFVAFRPAALGGPVRYVIIDGHSMEPTLNSGDLVLTRTSSDYEVGDVISFEAPIGHVMHRIVGGDPEQGFVSQGDNNQVTDPWRTDVSQISGKMWFSMPWGSQLRWIGPLSLTLSSAFFGVLAFSYARSRRHSLEV